MADPASNSNNDGEEEAEQYEIDYIYKDRIFGSSQHFFVHWKGYPDSENSWVNINDMACEDLLDEYLTRKDKKADERNRIRREKKRLESESSGSSRRTAASDQPSSSKKKSRLSETPKKETPKEKSSAPGTPKKSKVKKIKIHYAGMAESDSEQESVASKDTPKKKKKATKDEGKPKARARIVSSDSETEEKPESSKKKKKADRESSVKPDKRKSTGASKTETASPTKKSSEQKTREDEAEKQKNKRKRKIKAIDSDEESSKGSQEQSKTVKPIPDVFVRPTPPRSVRAPSVKLPDQPPKDEIKEEEKVSAPPVATEEKVNDEEPISDEQSRCSSDTFITAPEEQRSTQSQQLMESVINEQQEDEESIESDSIRRRNAQKEAFEFKQSQQLMETVINEQQQDEEESIESDSIRRRNAQKEAFEFNVAAREEAIRKSRSPVDPKSVSPKQATVDKTPDSSPEIRATRHCERRDDTPSTGAEDELDIEKNAAEDDGNDLAPDFLDEDPLGDLQNEDFSILRPTTVQSVHDAHSMIDMESPLPEDFLAEEEEEEDEEEEEEDSEDSEDNDDDLVTLEELQNSSQPSSTATSSSPRLNGFQKKWKPEFIVFFLVEPGVKIEEVSTTANEKCFGAVKFQGRNVVEAISYKEIKEKHPELLVDYFARIHKIESEKGMDITRKSEFIEVQTKNLDFAGLRL